MTTTESYLFWLLFVGCASFVAWIALEIAEYLERKRLRRLRRAECRDRARALTDALFDPDNFEILEKQLDEL